MLLRFYLVVQENANIYKHEKFNSQCPVGP